jgi:hypothetical protein
VFALYGQGSRDRRRWLSGPGLEEGPCSPSSHTLSSLTFATEGEA